MICSWLLEAWNENTYNYIGYGGAEAGGGALIKYCRERLGHGKYRYDLKIGIESRGDGKGLVHVERIIDKEKNYYFERVVDFWSNEVIRSVEHPLSEHTGHGSAKRKSVNS